MTASAHIRSGTETDLPRLTEIYNHYVAHTAITFDVEPVSVEARRRGWFVNYHEQGPHRLLVAELDGAVVGYATSGRFREKAAYASSVETSIYVHVDHHRRGVGRALYAALLPVLSAEGLHRAYAGITLPNDASIHLHAAFGFREVGTFREVGLKFGRYHDVRWFERTL